MRDRIFIDLLERAEKETLEEMLLLLVDDKLASIKRVKSTLNRAAKNVFYRHNQVLYGKKVRAKPTTEAEQHDVLFGGEYRNLKLKGE